MLTPLTKGTRHGCTTSHRALARQRSAANPTRRPPATLARRQNAEKKQESQPANLSLYAHCLRAFTWYRAICAYGDLEEEEQQLRLENGFAQWRLGQEEEEERRKRKRRRRRGMANWS